MPCKQAWKARVIDMVRSANRMEVLSLQYFATLAPVIRELQAVGVDVIRLDIGSPDLPPPAPVIEALSKSAVKENHHGYQHHRGTGALRHAWANYYEQYYGVELDPNREILPLLGTKEGIFHLTQALINPGEIALIPDPAYLTYSSGTSFAGGEPYLLPLEEGNDYWPNLDAIPGEIAARARLMWLNYPNNPSGAVAKDGSFTAALEFAREYDILICQDAAYSQITYDGYRAPSILEIPEARDYAVEFNTLSKSYNMAGWRVGVVVGNTQALEALYVLKSHADSGHFLPILDAATEALKTGNEWITGRNEIYRKRRDLVVERLKTLGAGFRIPRGAIYLWFQVPAGMASNTFTESLLKDTGVSLAPGSIFGTRGEGYARLSLCVPEARLHEAMERLISWWLQNAREGGEDA